MLHQGNHSEKIAILVNVKKLGINGAECGQGVVITDEIKTRKPKTGKIITKNGIESMINRLDN